MKKLITILSLILVMTIVMGTACSANAQGTTNTVILSIRLNRNFLIAKHTVDVYMDGTKIGFIGQGECMTVGVVLSGGYHELTFRDAEDPSTVQGRWVVGVLPDQCCISCTVQTHLLYVEVRDQKLTTGEGIMIVNNPDTENERGYVVDIIDAIF